MDAKLKKLIIPVAVLLIGGGAVYLYLKNRNQQRVTNDPAVFTPSIGIAGVNSTKITPGVVSNQANTDVTESSKPSSTGIKYAQPTKPTPPLPIAISDVSPKVVPQTVASASKPIPSSSTIVYHKTG